MSVQLYPSAPTSPQKGYATSGSLKHSDSGSDDYQVELCRRGRTDATQDAENIWKNLFGEERDAPTPPPVGHGG
ncbi:MAG: hypothetical protein P0S96_01680 [Simkaniaceae bacterium]|nr:hypothetical protein [Candidatus Sacchlamyda saccharinae]